MSEADFWNKTAAKYSKSAIADPSAYEETLDRIKTLLQPNHRVLEIGCGTGATALELASRVDRYLATDFSEQMIDIAQSKQSPGTAAHLRFAVHAADDMPEAPHDVILALNLLHLVPDPQFVIQQAFAAMPSGGLFIAKTALMSEGRWFLPIVIKVMRLFGKAPFVCQFSEAELREMLELVGFEISETLMQPDIAPRLFTIAKKPRIQG